MSIPWGRFLGVAVVMGMAPSEWRAMTPGELFEVLEAWTEARGGTSHRQRASARAELARLKRRYPDMPADGTT